MNTKHLLNALLISVGLAATAHATAVLTLNPASGDVSGKAGDTLGWGFALSSPADFAVVSSSNFCLGASGTTSLCIAPTLGVFTDFIATNFTIAGPAPESPTVTEPFDAATSSGVGQFIINADAAIGDTNVGQLVVTYDLYDVDPLSAAFNPTTDLISAGNFLTATAAVTVSNPVNVSPEPSYGLFIGIFVGSLLLWFRRRGVCRGS
jgi:hypothetical protein